MATLRLSGDTDGGLTNIDLLIMEPPDRAEVVIAITPPGCGLKDVDGRYIELDAANTTKLRRWLDLKSPIMRNRRAGLIRRMRERLRRHRLT